MERELKLLLVEDSEDDAELVVLALERWGFRVSSSRVDTREGMQQALGSGEWEVIVADHKMPRFTMDEALALALEKAPDVPFIIVSATILEESAIHAMRQGARDFIMKDKLARLAPAIDRELKEAALRRERRNLEEHVRLNQRMESLGVLAGGVAHDFNNLLVGIMGNASLVIDMLPESSTVIPLLDDVVLASQKAADLTRQMLAYAGKGRFVSEPANLSALVQDIAGLVRASMSRKVRLELKLDPNLPPIEADSTQIQQLVMNLLINGAESMGGREGTVTVTTGMRAEAPGPADYHFVATGNESGPYVFLIVSDTGCGMDEQTKSRIFEPFFTTKFTGRGLGLSAAIGIVRGHKGALKVESAPGKGSTFEVLFPALAGQTVRKRPATFEHGSHRASAPGGQILVVDDEEVVRRAAKSALERQGYTVLLAENGQRAAEAFKTLSDRIVLVLLDLTMPVMGGKETFDDLRNTRWDVKILVTSGYDEAKALQDFPRAEVSGFLQKPYTSLELVEKVSSILGTRAAAV